MGSNPILATTNPDLKIAQPEGEECSAFNSDDYQYSSDYVYGGQWSKCLTQSLPKPSDTFIQKYIKEYNNGNIITEVEVEYESKQITTLYEYNQGIALDYKTILKVAPDNTITIKPLVETQDDVWKQAMDVSLYDLIDWLEENYNVPTKK